MSDATVPRLPTFAGFPLGSWAFALRVWIAIVAALYVAFWLQLEAASSAAVCVGILAFPTRGQAFEKAGFRFLATAIGVAVSIVLVGAFSQTRDLLLLAFAAWVGLCVCGTYVLDGNRAYAAVLSGYTVAIVAIQEIDAPQQLDQADVNLGRTRVRSPVNGYVTNLLMRVGDFAHQGTANVSIIDSDSYWIDGYFEETKMARVCVGDRVEAKLTGYAQPIMGHVATVTRGIGVSNAASGTQGLPNVDAVFTWVRLAQRIPVRIAIDQAPTGVPLVSGMTATVTILEPADRRLWLDAVMATMAARLSDVLDGPPARPGCIPAITTERGPTQSLPVDQEGPPASPGQLNPGLAPGMNLSPR
jgi:multidrug efflux pump subunit AcrA (membrane-fusion protein)